MEELIKTLEEIKEHQMQTQQLARTTTVYKLADKALNIALHIHDAVGRSEQCCSPTDGFYLGTTCPHCNKPFRKDIK